MKRQVILVFLFLSSLKLYALPDNLLEGMDLERDPPLHRAISEGKFDVAENLLKLGVKPNERDSSGKTAFHVLIQRKGIQDIYEDFTRGVEVLMKYGNSPHEKTLSGDSLYHLLVERKDIVSVMEIFDIVFELGVDPRDENDRGETPKQLARRRKKRNLAMNIDELVLKKERQEASSKKELSSLDCNRETFKSSKN